MSGHVAAIIAAAGSGLRFGAEIPKALIQLGDRTLLEHAVAAISPTVDQIIVTAPATHLSQYQALLGSSVTVVVGGQTRSESIRAGLAAVSSDAKYVLIHDAARALASTDLANRVLLALQKGDVAVIPGIPQIDTIKSVDENGYPLKFEPRKAAERDVIISGEAVPVVKRGVFLYSGVIGTPAFGSGLAVADAGDGSLKVVAAGGTNVVAKALGPKDSNGFVLIDIKL